MVHDIYTYMYKYNFFFVYIYKKNVEKNEDH